MMHGHTYIMPKLQEADSLGNTALCIFRRSCTILNPDVEKRFEYFKESVTDNQ